MTSILCLETATQNCSVAIVSPEGTLGARAQRGEGYVHAEQLHVFIDEVLRQTDVRPDAIAVSSGPGSYTGLRIGVSAAKGLALGFDIPLIAVETLAHFALEQTISHPGKTHYVPLIDARRMEVYCNTFNSSASAISRTEAHILSAQSFQAILDKGPALFFGEASTKASDVIKHPNAIFIHDLWPSAEGMRILAQEKYAAQQFENIAEFEPFYLKDFIAGKPKKLL